MSFQDHFSTKAAIYARSRPAYPAELFAHLAGLAPGLDLVWDCGAGNGQASVGLAAHFARVVASEPSAAQLAEAVPHPRVTYVQRAELVPELADGSVDMVTAAQAAHWFDLGKFYPEVRRVCRPGALLAVWNYAICRISPKINPLVRRFHDVTVKAYWPPERRHAETCYQHLSFPFPELDFPSCEIQVDWTLEEFLAYLRTWSAVTRYTAALGTDPVTAFGVELAQEWGEGARRVTWPVGGRLGRVGKGDRPSPVS